MKDGNSREIWAEVADLDEDGLNFLAICRRQSPHLATILAERNGRVFVTVADGDALGSDDVPSVRVVSNLTRRERALTYGMDNLTLAQSSGNTGIAGWIPTDAYLDRLAAAYGDMDERDTRTWTLPGELVRKRRCARLDGAAIINDLGAALREWCARGQFTVQ